MRAKSQINFTHKALHVLPLPVSGKRTVHFDTNVKNLCVIVTDTGSKTFYVRKVIDGRSRRVRLGTFPDLSVENARKKALQVKAAIAEGDNPYELEKQKKEELSLNELFDVYFERHSIRHKKPNTQRADRYLFRNYLQERYGHRKLSSLRRDEIERFHDLLRKDKGLYTANRMLALLRGMLNKAIEWGYLRSENPAAYVKAFREKSRDRFLTGEELPRFLRALDEEPNEDMRHYFTLSLLTGARKRNLLAMRWDELDLGREVWRIEDTKNHEPQDVYLCSEAIEILRDRKQKRQDSPYVFPGTGITGHIVEPKSAWRRILQRADIENLRIHDLRRTLGSYQAISGSSLTIIGKSLGHKSMAATQVYSRLSNDPIRESVNRAVGVMMKLGGKGDGDA